MNTCGSRTLLKRNKAEFSYGVMCHTPLLTPFNNNIKCHIILINIHFLSICLNFSCIGPCVLGTWAFKYLKTHRPTSWSLSYYRYWSNWKKLFSSASKYRNVVNLIKASHQTLNVETGATTDWKSNAVENRLVWSCQGRSFNNLKQLSHSKEKI